MNKYASWIIILAITAAVIGGMVWYGSRPGKYDAFAMCIKESGAEFYGAFWCPHCQAQKALFGRSAKKLPYVECSTPDGQGQLPVCNEKKIETYPTWVFKDGTIKTGEVPLSELSSATGCPLTVDKQ